MKLSYLRIDWKSDIPAVPDSVFYELDAERFQVRRAEFFADGHAYFADQGTGELRRVRIPTPEECEAPRKGSLISKEEFEEAWARAREMPFRGSPFMPRRSFS